MAYNIIGTVDLASIYPDGQITTTGRITLTQALTELKKDQFANDDRIRIIYDQDTKHFPILETVVRTINSVDITNCFILITTGNEKIVSAIRHLVETVSTDKTQLDFEIVDREFIVEDSVQYTYNDAEPTKISLDQLNDREKFLLTESQTFCMLPWIHLHAYPTGDAYPCCHAEHLSGNFGNCQTTPMKEIWSGDKMKQLRDDMLNDRKNPACTRCYEQEKSGFFSGRKSANKHHGHHIDKVKDVDPPFEMTYWDIRFSNLCNLSCRSCGHIFSSSWYQDQVNLAGEEWAKNNKPLFWAGRHKLDMVEQLMEHLEYVDQIYFAGGEPLMMDEHYVILEELERRKRFDVRLIYNSNFTKTKLKDRYVFDYWKKFDSVAVGASLDAMGTRAEYIRKGTKWADVEDNRRKMLEICPEVDFYISPTLSIQNALHIPDFHRDWVEKGLLKPQDLNINLLQDPEWLRIDIAPQHYKDKIKAKYEEHLEWLRPLDKLNRATVGFESAINFLETDNTHLLPKFFERMTKLDEMRGETLLDVIPELNEIRINN